MNVSGLEFSKLTVHVNIHCTVQGLSPQVYGIQSTMNTLKKDAHPVPDPIIQPQTHDYKTLVGFHVVWRLAFIGYICNQGHDPHGHYP